jgi:lipoprotein-releasing system ATP-binding protein
MKNPILEARNINKFFHLPDEFQVLTDINFSMNKGEFVSIMGKSGCGKSTLLYLLSTMDTDYEGEVWLDEQNLSGLNSHLVQKIF